MKEKCSFCNNEIDLTDKFCPNCGKKLPEKNAPFTTGEKIKIYLLSFVIAPFGLYWFFKFFKNENPEKRKTALYSLYITIFMIVVIVIINIYFVKTLQTYIDSYNLESFGY
ncbi:MAG TPA: zinc ribbon domain-containing protein [bacterium]|jgi:uncharacterized membrane protein YvbJ|nr:zinc ribbon domain-containing protein [bacterium]